MSHSRRLFTFSRQSELWFSGDLWWRRAPSQSLLCAMCTMVGKGMTKVGGRQGQGKYKRKASPPQEKLKKIQKKPPSPYSAHSQCVRLQTQGHMTRTMSWQNIALLHFSGLWLSQTKQGKYTDKRYKKTQATEKIQKRCQNRTKIESSPPWATGFSVLFLFSYASSSTFYTGQSVCHSVKVPNQQSFEACELFHATTRIYHTL